MQKVTYFLAALAGFLSGVSADCARDNCLRAVVASAFTTRSGIPDCNSFMLSTVIPPTSTSTVTVTATATDAVTVTATNTVLDTINIVETAAITQTQTITATLPGTTITSTINGVLKRRGGIYNKRQSNGRQPAPGPTQDAAVTIHPSVMPAYAAAACKSVTASYLYACSCVGATASVTTLSAPVTTITVTSTLATVLSTAATDTVVVTQTTTQLSTATTFVTAVVTATVPGDAVVQTTRVCTNPSTFYLKIAESTDPTLVGRYIQQFGLGPTVSYGNTLFSSLDKSAAVIFNLSGGNLQYRLQNNPQNIFVTTDVRGHIFTGLSPVSPPVTCSMSANNYLSCSSRGFVNFYIPALNPFLMLENSTNGLRPSVPIKLQAVCS